MARLLLCALFIAILGGCREATKVDVGAIEKILKQKEAEWNRAYAEHDAAAVASAYADDAALAYPGVPLAAGIAAVRRQTQSLGSDPNFQLHFASDHIQISASGDLAYSRGHYTLTVTDRATNGPATSKGNYLTVWRMQKGAWKAVENFITPAVRH